MTVCKHPILCKAVGSPPCWRPGNVVGPQRSPGTCSRAPTPLPSAGNWVCFSCSIPPLFVLSHSLPMINTTGKLASFWRFSLTTGSLPSDSLVGFTGHNSPATRHSPLATRHLPLPPTTLPRWRLHDTDSRFGKDRTGPDRDERSLSFSMALNRAIPTEKSIRLSSLPTVA